MCKFISQRLLQSTYRDHASSLAGSGGAEVQAASGAVLAAAPQSTAKDKKLCERQS